MSNQRPRIVFDKNGVCAPCNYTDIKKLELKKEKGGKGKVREEQNNEEKMRQRCQTGNKLPALAASTTKEMKRIMKIDSEKKSFSGRNRKERKYTYSQTNRL